MSGAVRAMTISALARACSVSTPTIRYYEKIELLPEAERTAAGQRRYTSDDVERLSFVRRCREFGFSIAQVRTLLTLSTSSDLDCRESRDIAVERANEIEGKIVELKTLQASLAKLIARCEEACLGLPGQDCLSFSQMRTCGC